MERLYGISYLFTKTPSVAEVSEWEKIIYNPLLVCCEANESDEHEIRKIQSEKSFALSYEQMLNKFPTIYQRDKVYSEMRKRSRESQERIISEYICIVIMQELRQYPNDDLTFIISDEFQSEKIIGRLGYLRLPLNRTHIIFVSRNISSFMSNYIEHYAIPPQNDLKLLFSDKYRGHVVGAYPEEQVLSMIRTFFCSFPQEGIYPLRINLFSQALNKNDLNNEKERIRKIFLSDKSELYSVNGGTGAEMTRLPQILVECEELIKNAKKE